MLIFSMHILQQKMYFLRLQMFNSLKTYCIFFFLRTGASDIIQEDWDFVSTNWSVCAGECIKDPERGMKTVTEKDRTGRQRRKGSKSERFDGKKE